MADNTNMQENYWKSIEELQGDALLQEARHHEFGAGVKDEFHPESSLSGLSRRKFLALLGTSAALATAGCADYPDKGEIVPYNRKPEEITLGKPNYYASTCGSCANSCGILIKTREGRPIKVDGNPDHPANQGKVCAKGQASVLNLYDPARLTEPVLVRGGQKEITTWSVADAAVLNTLKNIGSKEIAFVTAPVVSPAFRKILSDFSAKYPTTKIYSYQQFDESNRLNAWEKSYGTREIPAIQWDKAKVVVTLEGDFLGVEGNSVENTVKFSKTRDVENIENYSRLYAVEANLSMTGMNADYRLRLTPDKQFAFVMALINEVAGKKGNGAAQSAASGYSLKEFGFDAKTIKALVEDLVKANGTAIVYCGRVLEEKTHVAVNLLNEVIGAQALYNYAAVSVASYKPSTFTEMAELAAKLNNGQVGLLVHIDCNPAFTLPSEIGYKNAIQKAPVSVTLTEFENETSAVSLFTLPVNHDFESWGDVQVRADVYSMKQPVIAPLYRTRQKEAAVLMWLNGSADGFSQELYHNYLMKFWETELYPSLGVGSPFAQFWNALLHDGVLLKKGVAASAKPFNYASLSRDNAKTGSGMSVLFTEGFSTGDGKFAHNGWLQELAHPVTKVTWDNYAAISYATSKKLDVKSDDVVEITVNGKKAELPVLVQPGLADDFIAVETGYGRESGPVVALAVGTNVNTLLSVKQVQQPFYYTNISVAKTGRISRLATTQDHHTYDEALIQDLHKKREIIREGTVAEYKKHPMFLKEETKPTGENMYPEFEYKEAKWAMAIDLNKCTGCGDCVVACSVENNVPVVGKDQVLLSREMQWLRIDRYYSGKPEDPKVSVQPMLCQHCDNAPCENVCPVVATNHSPDGLNQMVYNRCVGTRYCSNNCPYKVRRFNFFNFRDHFQNGHYTQPVMQLAANPEVTIRSRGVMEKCTFCTHRIMDGREEATREGKTFDGAGITSACQDACAANAIVFGNANDPESHIAKLREHKLGYSVLEELNVKPNVTYIAKLRNTHSEEV